MDAVVAALIGWIAANSSLAPPAPPQIAFVPRHRLAGTFSGAGKLSEFLHLEAFYHPASATVHLPEGWRPDRLRDRSVLLHELVHHAQWQNEVVVSCPGSLERQAYHLQIMWLRKQGVEEPYALIGTNAMTVLMIGACEE